MRRGSESIQILFLDKIPDSAAVNETVELVRKTGNARAAGFTKCRFAQSDSGGLSSGGRNSEVGVA